MASSYIFYDLSDRPLGLVRAMSYIFYVNSFLNACLFPALILLHSMLQEYKFSIDVHDAESEESGSESD